MDILSNGPASISDLMAAAGDPVTVLPTLFHLLWSRIISTDLRHHSLGKEAVVSFEEARCQEVTAC